MSNPNLTANPSLVDYGKMVAHYSFESLLEELDTNQWLAKHTQQTDIDYFGRYFVCLDALKNTVPALAPIKSST